MELRVVTWRVTPAGVVPGPYPCGRRSGSSFEAAAISLEFRRLARGLTG